MAVGYSYLATVDPHPKAKPLCAWAGGIGGFKCRTDGNGRVDCVGGMIENSHEIVSDEVDEAPVVLGDLGLHVVSG